MTDDRIYANGINGMTGHYLTEPVSPAELAAWGEHPTSFVSMATRFFVLKPTA